MHTYLHVQLYYQNAAFNTAKYHKLILIFTFSYMINTCFKLRKSYIEIRCTKLVLYLPPRGGYGLILHTAVQHLSVLLVSSFYRRTAARCQKKVGFHHV